MIRSNKMMRKALALLLALCVAASLTPCVWADEGPMEDVGEPPIQEAVGSITLGAAAGDNEEMRAELSQAVTDVDVYLVATSPSLGVYEAAAGFESLADEIAAIDLNTSMSALSKEVEAVLDGAGEAIRPVNTFEGLAVIGGVVEFYEQGLYLIVPHATTVATHVYTFNRVLLGIPSLGTEEWAQNGRDPNTNIPDEALEWLYDFTIILKPEQSDAMGRLVIEKQLLTYNESLHGQNLGPIRFSFLVTGVNSDGEEVYSNVVDILFDGPGTGTTLVENIPVGLTVTVTEISDTYGYTLVQSSNTTFDIVPISAEGPDGPPTATFVNDWDGDINPEVSVANRFTNDGMGYVVDQDFSR